VKAGSGRARSAGGTVAFGGFDDAACCRHGGEALVEGGSGQVECKRVHCRAALRSGSDVDRWAWNGQPGYRKNRAPSGLLFPRRGRSTGRYDEGRATFTTAVPNRPFARSSSMGGGAVAARLCSLRKCLIDGRDQDRSIVG
jgi:hypothetical protein